MDEEKIVGIHRRINQSVDAMRVTFILPPVSMSGGVRVVAIYAEALQRRGHEVILISAPRQKIPLYDKFHSLVHGGGWLSDSKSRPSHLDGRGLDHRVLDRYRPPDDEDVPDADVIVSTWWETAEWVDSLGDNKGAKVYFIQGHEVFPYLPVDRIRATYHLPFHKIVVSQWLKKTISHIYGYSVIDVVPNSVDHGQFYAEKRRKQAKPTVGFIYSSSWVKGVDVTLAAVATLREEIPDLRAVAFGPYEPNSDLGLESWIEFYCAPAQDSIRALYAQCDVWVTASRSEGFNLPAMEAMACRTPVVSTGIGWPEEAVIDGQNGYLVDLDDVVGLKQAVASVLLLSDPDWQHMSDNAFETVSDSAWERSTDLFEGALEHACTRAERGEIRGRCECNHGE